MVKIALISFMLHGINIRTLAAYLKRNGYEAYCFFCAGPFTDANSKELIRILKEKNIGLVGLSVITDHYASACLLTDLIKKNTALPVIWGGAHVDVMPEESLRHADMVCRGEGEEALLELAGEIDRGRRTSSLKNIWFNSENGVVRNDIRNLEENLDRYPIPDFGLETQYVMNETGFDVMRDLLAAETNYDVITSRGCPHRCGYCYNNYRYKQYQGKGRYLRFRSIEHFIEELSQAKKINANLKNIHFWDDNFLSRSVDELMAFKKLYSERINLPFFILAEPMFFHKEKLKILRECGLYFMQIGIQTGSERISREIYQRDIPQKALVDIAHFTHQLGIRVIYDIIFNNPYEAPSDIAETIKLFLRFPAPFLIQGFNLIFYPGTDITERALRDGFISERPPDTDFSTIESRLNSPLLTQKKSVISSRFYTINYDPRGKAYWNSLFQIVGLPDIPRSVILFFLKSGIFLNKLLLGLFIKIYLSSPSQKSRVSWLLVFPKRCIGKLLRILKRHENETAAKN